MTTNRFFYWLAALSATTALVGCGRDDSDGSNHTTVAPAVEFLQFPNPQPSLGVADYDIVADNTSGSTFTYTLSIVSTNGSSKTVSGTLNSGASNTVITSFEQKTPGGLAISFNTGGASVRLRLCVPASSPCANGSLTYASASGANPSVDLPNHKIDTVAYATAYYAQVDPSNDRDTLAKFRSTNGFGSSCAPNATNEFEVRFRDVLDLGYGRHMCARGSTSAVGNVAVWVENFQVTAIPGVKYGPLNLEAVVNDDRRWHVGTNAIEYTPANPNAAVSSSNPRIVKFYTFNPDGTRRLLVDLDGRGAKAMPVPCISCHGGHGLPLTSAGLFPAIRTSPRGETFARMQPLNVDTLDFSTAYPYRRADQEASLKNINRLVLCTYPLVGAAGAGGEDDCRLAVVNSQWQGTAAEMVKRWYGGTGANGLPNASANDTFVPTGWANSAGGNPANAETLYQTVVAPNCRVCHLLRGNANAPGAHDIDFTTYTKFAGTDPTTGFNSRIKHHVFDRGNMPLALLKFEHFWESSAPATLASFITGAISGGSVLQPTRPVAKTGPDRTIVTNVAHKLSAAESVNATSYRWRVSSSNSANTTLTNANTIRPTFTATANGVYTLELIVSNGLTDSTPATLTIGAVASLQDGSGFVTITDPADIRFSHIRTVLQENTTTYLCTSGGCHTNPTANPGGPPVYYEDYDRDGVGGYVAAVDDHEFYLDVRARINFTDIESSRILFRPSGHHHPGGQRPNFDTSITPGSAGRGAYDLFLNWILNGAPE